MKYTHAITPEVKDVLLRSVITGTGLTLPSQLDRALYEKVNKVLLAAGGKWNRSAKAHIFTADPRDILGLALATGTITDEALAKQKDLQQYFTPKDIAAQLARKADVRNGMTVLEPSCGTGNLMAAVLATMESHTKYDQVEGYEIDPVVAKEASALGVKVVVGDFLAQAPRPVFDRVVMNPPFANGRDMQHVSHALQFLKPGGKLVAIMSPAWTFHSSALAQGFRTAVLAMVHKWEELPANSFKESGAGVNTGILTLQLQNR
jgi:predicted RNA methylase